MKTNNLLHESVEPSEMVPGITDPRDAQRILDTQGAEIRNIKSALNQHAIVSIANERGEITYVNDKFCKIAKYSREELLGQDHRIVASGNHTKDFFRELWRSIAQGETWHGEIQNRAKDGNYFWIDMTIAPFLDSSGVPFQYISISTDITTQKKNELLIFEAEQRLKLGAEVARIGIWDLDLTTGTLTWDDTMYHLYGISREQFSGGYEAWSTSLHPDDKARAKAEVEKTIRGESPVLDTIFRIVMSDGSTRYIKARGIVHLDLEGKASRMIGGNWDITADITELKRVEIELSERTKEAESATQAKSQFLANMSHEIRTPLTSIIGYCETLLDDDLSVSERREAAGAAYSSARYLLSIVSNVLDMSKLEAGKAEIEVTRVNLFDLMNEILLIKRQKIANKHLTIEIEYDYPVPKVFYTDLTALKQILFNLVGNARKFTESGEIKIHVSFDRGKNLLNFSVIDTGIGISPEQQNRLFQVFSQGDSSTTRRFGGSGLGLSISKHLAHLLGGDISVESVPGKGSTFTATISAGSVTEDGIAYADYARVQLSPRTGNQLPIFTGKVLVVEDSIEIQKYVRLLLTKMGFVVTVVEDGEKALDSAINGEFRLILMDMHLPRMDGRNVTRLIRERGITTPILALSADVKKENIEDCFQVGCSDFLPKPFSRALLVEKLRVLLGTKLVVEEISTVDSSEIDFTETMKKFINSFSERIEELENAYLSKQFDSLTRNSHKLAGAAAFAYPAVYQPLLKLNETSEKQNAEGCSRLLTELKEIHVKHASAMAPVVFKDCVS